MAGVRLFDGLEIFGGDRIAERHVNVVVLSRRLGILQHFVEMVGVDPPGQAVPEIILDVTVGAADGRFFNI